MDELIKESMNEFSIGCLRSIFSINLGEYPGHVKAQRYGLKTAEMAGGIEINCIIIYRIYSVFYMLLTEKVSVMSSISLGSSALMPSLVVVLFSSMFA